MAIMGDGGGCSETAPLLEAFFGWAETTAAKSILARLMWGWPQRFSGPGSLH